MSFPPSETPLPADSPVANTSSPLRPPLPGLAPLVSPPLAPPSVVVLPPESSVVPVASPPLPPESNTLLPPVLPPDVAPPPEPPQVATPLPHETPPSPPLVKAPPPEAPLIAPGNDPLPPGPPTQPVISPSIPSPMAPTTPPLPPLPPLNPTIPRPSPVFSQPPSETIPQPPPEVPLTPEVSPLPLTSPLAPKTSPFAPETPSTTLSPATRHGVPYTPPISLPLANGNLPVSSKHSDVSAGLILGFVIGGLFLLLVIAIVLLCCKFRRRKNDATPSLYPKDNPKGQLSEQNGSAPGAHVVNIQDSIFLQPPLIRSRCSPVMDPWSRNISPVPPPAPYRALGLSSVIFSYDELMVATNGFSEANLIGQGGFGYVHKGVLPSGKEIAVKKLKAGSSQGDSEFQAELEIIGRVHHKHLVSLEGYCITSSERLLVYEFVPNNTLEFHLHGNGQPVMQWAIRLKIATGSARGLAYLHEDCNPTIIHRDIKAANILLNHNFEAKVSDFGLAKSFSGAITHITTRVVGTFGYLAPEYASSGKLTDKSDIYSFGVVLLELITGRPPISDSETDMRNGLVDWARPLLNQVLEEGDFRPLVDPRLESNYNVSEMTTMVACAAACVRHSAWLRPRMSQIVRALEGDISANDLSEGIRSMHDSSGSSTYDAYQHRDEMKDFNMVMASWQQGISGTTSEYGLKLSGSSSEESGRYCAKDRK